MDTMSWVNPPSLDGLPIESVSRLVFSTVAKVGGWTQNNTTSDSLTRKCVKYR